MRYSYSLLIFSSNAHVQLQQCNNATIQIMTNSGVTLPLVPYLPNKQVIPKDYHEIVLYLEGKRALDKVFKDGHYIE